MKEELNLISPKLATKKYSIQLFLAINGRNGSVLWEFEQHEIKTDLMSVYDAQFISDLDGDGSPEVLAVHGGDELSDPGEA